MSPFIKDKSSEGKNDILFIFVFLVASVVVFLRFPLFHSSYTYPDLLLSGRTGDIYPYPCYFQRLT